MAVGLGFGMMVLLSFGRGHPVAAAEITKTEGVFFEPDIIKITGLIGFEDFPAFARVASTTSNAIIVLDSPGGKVGPTFDIAMLARARGFSTYIEAGAKCHSGCANIWLAGYRKFIERGGEIGLHPSSSVENGQKVAGSNITSALMGWYYAQLGMPREVVMQIFELDPLTITVYDPDIIQDLGIDATVREAKSLQTVRKELTSALASGTRANTLNQILLRGSTLHTEGRVEMKSTRNLSVMIASKALRSFDLGSGDDDILPAHFLFQEPSTTILVHNSLNMPLSVLAIDLSNDSDCQDNDNSDEVAIVELSDPVPAGTTAAAVLPKAGRDLLLDKFGDHSPSCLKLTALRP